MVNDLFYPGDLISNDADGRFSFIFLIISVDVSGALCMQMGRLYLFRRVSKKLLEDEHFICRWNSQ